MDNIICDRYQITRLLITGSFSTIYLAQALLLSGRPTCILKQFKPQSDDLNLLKVAKELFDREAKVLRQIEQHPQIPQLLDYFEVAGDFYLVQEYIAGETLREFRNHNLWDEQQAIKFLQSILPVLAFIHQQGIIHRDIKPENIILRSPDRKPFLIDFGAVKLRSQTTQSNTSPTIIHSYGYTPPEQLAGYAEENSDIYALGMTCIEMLLGEKPTCFAQTNENGNGVIEKLEEIGISEGLRLLFNRLVCMDARQRYQSAHAVIADLNLLKINCKSAQPNDYTPTFISCPAQESLDLGYTSTQLSIDSLPKEPIDKVQNAKHKAANLQRRSTQLQLPQKVDPTELGRKLSQCLDYETRESQIYKITAVVKATLLKQSWLLFSISCFAIGAALLYFFYLKSTSIQSSTYASVSTEYDLNQKAENSLKFQLITQLQGDTSSIRFLEFSAGQTLVSASRSGLIQLYNLQNATVQQVTKTSSEILAVARGQQRELLAFATADRSIELWNLTTMKQVQQVSAEQLVWSLAMGNTRSSLLAGGLNSIERWNVFPESLKLIETLEFSTEKFEPVRSIVLSADGSILAAGDATGKVKIIHFDFNRTQLSHAHTEAVNSVVMDASETILLTGSDDDTIRVWNLHALQEYERTVIQAGLGGVTAIASHPNSNIVAAGGIYGTVKLWNWQTGQLLGTLLNPTTGITALAFSPDGNSFAVGTRDGKTAIFSIVK
ncbi:serine/threonine protein kinase [Trichocoleus sp. FACHB-591]|uniref:serine/threonine-protein kinase n=1 Tax=Trichocoleus sp. FACHB-591 TaxID=2692872 RepID=UPI0016868156|nr:serine/threonine-protein kinase [Trichocoleus sp. FACHB-591]MBD2095667.1 serine/threonine protein kinase [Trichocoleus sp. FACHB-591]